MMPLSNAPAIRIPMDGVKTGSHRRYHKSSPRFSPKECPTTAIANQKKLNKTKKIFATRARLSQFNSFSFIKRINYFTIDKHKAQIQPYLLSCDDMRSFEPGLNFNGGTSTRTRKRIVQLHNCCIITAAQRICGYSLCYFSVSCLSISSKAFVNLIKF